MPHLTSLFESPMKREIHRSILGMSIIAMLPGALFGLIISVGAVGHGIENGVLLTDLAAIVLSLFPLLFCFSGEFRASQ